MKDLLFGLPTESWLTLSLIPGVGTGRLARLWTYLETLETENAEQQLLFDELPDTIASIDFKTLRALGWKEHGANSVMRFLDRGVLCPDVAQQLEQTQNWLQAPDHRIVFRGTPEYPSLLNEISVPPTLLYVHGNPKAWAQPTLGVVGAREASAYGRQVAEHWSQQLSEAGFTITSGGARGIDTFAHRGAIAANGPTVAVMGAGLNTWYPRQNKDLFESILDHNGALISEYSLTTEVRPQLFPPRNRIISGMSAGVFVVEASERSGSLISARYALEENREVFALPGRIGEPQAAGTNQLIRQGASLVTCVDDILSELPRGLRLPLANAHQEAKQKALPEGSEEAQWLFNCLQKERIGMDFDALVRLTKWQAPDLSQVLMELELAGVLINAQGQYQIAP